MRFASDTIASLEAAAELRFQDGAVLFGQRRFTGGTYLWGYAIEMCLTAACFRSEGWGLRSPIDREVRQRRMAFARNLRPAAAERPLMSSDPHPLDGWARLLEWKRTAAADAALRQRLREAVRHAETAMANWRPELRYKSVVLRESAAMTVRDAAQWFLDHRGKLSEINRCPVFAAPSKRRSSRTNGAGRWLIPCVGNWTAMPRRTVP